MIEIETEEYKGYEIKVGIDEDPESPREWENLGTMACFHGRYTLGDDNDFNTPDELQAFFNKNDHVKLPIYMYEHGGITVSTTEFSCPWDSGQLGFIYVTKQKIREEYSVKRVTKKTINAVLEVLEEEVKTFDKYVMGQVLSYTIEKDGEIFDSCGGFFEEEDEVMKEAKRQVDCEIAITENLPVQQEV